MENMCEIDSEKVRAMCRAGWRKEERENGLDLYMPCSFGEFCAKFRETKKGWTITDGGRAMEIIKARKSGFSVQDKRLDGILKSTGISLVGGRELCMDLGQKDDGVFMVLHHLTNFLDAVFTVVNLDLLPTGDRF